MKLTLAQFSNLGFVPMEGDALHHKDYGDFLYQKCSRHVIVGVPPSEITIVNLAWRPMESFEHKRFTQGNVLIEMAPCQMWRPVLSDLKEKAEKSAEGLIRECINAAHQTLIGDSHSVGFMSPGTVNKLGLALIEELKKVGLMKDKE